MYRHSSGVPAPSSSRLMIQLLPTLFSSMPSLQMHSIAFLDTALPPNSSCLPFLFCWRLQNLSCLLLLSSYCLCISNQGFKPIPNYTSTAACNNF